MTHEKDEQKYAPPKPCTLSLSPYKQSPSHPDPIETDEIFQLHRRCGVVLRSGHEH
jgi:hypothetical protein